MEKRIINQVVLLPVEKITANPNQPRRYFDPLGLEDLAESIRHSGLLQPITVRRLEGERYELIAGERRLRAFERLHYYEIPCIVEDCDKVTSHAWSLIENMQRADLHFLEQARGIRELMEGYGFTQTEVASRLGFTQSSIANKLRLLRFDDKIQEKITKKGLTERHARCLLQLLDQPEILSEALDQIEKRCLNVAQTEQYVKTLLGRSKGKPVRIFLLKDVRIFVNTIHKAIDTMKLAGIQASSEQHEEGDQIIFTVRIPKKSAFKKTSA